MEGHTTPNLLFKVLKITTFTNLKTSDFILLVLGNCQSCDPLFMGFCVEVCYSATEIITGCWMGLG